jgi:hypothetical protein
MRATPPAPIGHAWLRVDIKKALHFAARAPRIWRREHERAVDGGMRQSQQGPAAGSRPVVTSRPRHRGPQRHLARDPERLRTASAKCGSSITLSISCSRLGRLESSAHRAQGALEPLVANKPGLQFNGHATSPKAETVGAANDVRHWALAGNKI